MDATAIARGPTTVKLKYLQGIVGPAGPTGPTGPSGPANTLTIGTVTALAYGEPATASVTGTAPTQTLSLGLPMGAQGPSGSVSDGDKGDIIVSSAGTVWTVDANAIGDAELRQSAALSVIGRSANSTGNVADIASGTDGHVLRQSGPTLGFGTVANAGLADMADSTFKMRASGSGSGPPIDGNATQARTALGLGTMATQAASAVAITGGTFAGASVATSETTNATTTPAAFRNLSGGSSALTKIAIGNDADASDFSVELNGSANVGGIGSRSVTIRATGGPMQLVCSGILYSPNVYGQTTGTGANVAVDSGGQIRRSTSSRRYKSNIRDYDRGIDAVRALRPVFYESKNSEGGTFAGLIAEEVHDAGLPEFVAYDGEGTPDALHYPNMIALLVKALQEAAAKIEALTSRIEALEG